MNPTATPFSPPFGPASVSCNGFHPKSNFLAVLSSTPANAVGRPDSN